MKPTPGIIIVLGSGVQAMEFRGLGFKGLGFRVLYLAFGSRNYSTPKPPETPASLK